MPKAPLSAVVQQCQSLLKPETFTDWDGAVNGLQVQNSGTVTKIAAAVDGTLTTVRMAVDASADLLIVHHGLFWTPQNVPWTGRRHELFSLLIKHNIAVYSSHLPLDAHPRIGNNVLLAKALGLVNLAPFFMEKGRQIGIAGRKAISRQELAEKLTRILGHSPTLLAGGKERCQRIGIVTGGAGAELRQAAAEGVDTFVTGEGPHWTHALAEDLGLNVFYGGHYATETFGVKALAETLSKKFKLPWTFLDHPSGL